MQAFFRVVLWFVFLEMEIEIWRLKGKVCFLFLFEDFMWQV